MQLAESKISSASFSPASLSPFGPEPSGFATGCRSTQRLRVVGGYGRTGCNLISRLRATNATERLLALTIAAFILTVAPPLLETVRTTITIALQILFQIGHLGFVAFQIFGR